MTFTEQIEAALKKPVDQEIFSKANAMAKGILWIDKNEVRNTYYTLLLRIRDLEAQVDSHVRILEMASEEACEGIHPDSYGEDICVRNPKKKVESYCASCLAKLAKQNDWKPINLRT